MKEKKYILSYHKYENGHWDYVEEVVTESNLGEVLNLMLPKNVHLLDSVTLKEVRKR